MQDCFVCKERLKDETERVNLWSFSEYSKVPLIVLLENLCESKFDQEDSEALYVGCIDCVLKVNEYDEMVYKAEKIRSDLLRMLSFSKVPSNDDDYFLDVVDVGETAAYISHIQNEEIHFASATEIKYESINENESLSNETAEDIAIIVEKLDEEEDIKLFDEELSANEGTEILSYKRTAKKLRKQSVILAKKSCPPPLTCKYCRITFSSRTDLRNHRKTSPKCQAYYICHVCGVEYKCSVALKTHMITHTGEFKIACAQCGKPFAAKSQLSKHLLTHTGEKRFTCEHCGKAFRSSSHLCRHMRVHTGDKPFECPHCSQKFAQGYNMKAHIKQKHFGISLQHSCQQCGMNFKRKCDLLKHSNNFSCEINLSVFKDEK